MKWSKILLIIGALVLVIGAVMSQLETFNSYSNYVLVAGAVIMFFRGAVRHRERDDENLDKK
jgi:hypothetical protein